MSAIFITVKHKVFILISGESEAENVLLVVEFDNLSRESLIRIKIYKMSE